MNSFKIICFTLLMCLCLADDDVNIMGNTCGVNGLGQNAPGSVFDCTKDSNLVNTGNICCYQKGSFNQLGFSSCQVNTVDNWAKIRGNATFLSDFNLQFAALTNTTITQIDCSSNFYYVAISLFAFIALMF